MIRDKSMHQKLNFSHSLTDKVILSKFLPRDAMLDVVYAVVVCLSVRLYVCVCVCHTPVLY